MKSAWELALERTGGALNKLPNDQKREITEIDNIRKAKLAAMEITYGEKLKSAATSEELEQIKDDMAVEHASIISKAERDKEAIRKNLKK